MTSSPDIAGAAGAEARARRTGELVFVGVLFAFAVFALALSFTIREPIGSSNVLGARVLPIIVTVFMAVTSAIAFIAVLRGDVGEADEGEDVDPDVRTSWRTVLFIVLAFASLIVVIPLAGWPLAVVVLFTCSSLALGGKSWWKAALIGLGLGLLTQILFGTLLGLSLPAFGDYLPEVFGG
ncbi:tripartite tricarboxylate transporter TctB family protein [Agromyces archimandritae]|uniref:Tripartite tricarboxylate transporter TctB family protein n=1 Tax=Agromyces archimandritae TaxID=2781962 RepID=A0A975FLQ8_9MICO|nr:tripartite tricarboxylate transporter TctB family protein [Agromyces archimandritae]QTX03778.1 tripartite tricarboxylate transporter TctB family protein [Agromyces archimandritae]